MVSSFSGLRAMRYRWAWFLAKCLAVSWAMEEVAPIIIIFWVFMVASYQFNFWADKSAVCTINRHLRMVSMML